MAIKDHPLENALWAHTALAPPETTILEGERQADVAIIGAGYTGLSSALHLAKEGVKVCVVEAAQIGRFLSPFVRRVAATLIRSAGKMSRPALQ